jgi:hypothetical protein
MILCGDEVLSAQSPYRMAFDCAPRQTPAMGVVAVAAGFGFSEFTVRDEGFEFGGSTHPGAWLGDIAVDGAIAVPVLLRRT